MLKKIVESIGKKKGQLHEEKIAITQKDLDGIDLKPLEKEVASCLEISNISLKAAIKTARGEDYIVVESSDLIDKAGVFKGVFSKVSVYTPNASVGMDDGKKVWWSLVSLRWESHRGGSNGGTILTAWYNFDDKKWNFEREKK